MSPVGGSRPAAASRARSSAARSACRSLAHDPDATVPACRAPHPPLRPDRRAPRRLAAEVAECRRCPGWSPGASRSPGRGGPPSATRSTGAVRSPASATRRPACSSSAWPRPPTAATAPAAHLHRRPLRRLAVRQPPPHRLRQPADLGLPRRRPRPDRLLHHRPGQVRPARQQAPPRQSATPAPLADRGARPPATSACVVALGAFAWDQALRHLGPVRPKPRFTHAAEAPSPARRVLVGSYHEPARTRAPAASPSRCLTACSRGRGAARVKETGLIGKGFQLQGNGRPPTSAYLVPVMFAPRAPPSSSTWLGSSQENVTLDDGQRAIGIVASAVGRAIDHHPVFAAP